jgi:hypothetical protein
MNHLIFYRITESPLSFVRSTNDTTCALCEQYNARVSVLYESRSLLQKEYAAVYDIHLVCVCVWYPSRAHSCIHLHQIWHKSKSSQGNKQWDFGYLAQVRS